MVAGRRGQIGDNVRDIAGQDFRPASDPAQTHHLVMAGGNALDLPNNIKTVCFIDALVNIDATRYVNANAVTPTH